MIIIYESVFVAPKNEHVDDQLEDSVDKRSFIGGPGERSGMQVLC
jgi:hypothetical protein